MNKQKFYIHSIILFTIFIVLTSSLGLFKIGILSDTFGDAYTAVNSSFSDKITNNLEYIDAYRYRPVLFLTLKGIVNINHLLGISYDNFIIYKLINFFLYIIFAFISGFIVLKITGNIKLSILAEVLILIFPNNIHNLCWSAAYFEILCGIFFLLALLYLLEFLNNGITRFIIFSNILFTLSLLTKEIAITFPFVCIIILYLMYGKAIFTKYKNVYIPQLLILISYFVSKTLLSKGIPVISGKYFGGDFWTNSVQIVFKSIIASFIPLDFSVLRLGFMELNILIIIYLILIIFFVIAILFGLIKQKKNHIVLLIILNFLVLISPYVYAGYIRPQLILLPFTLSVIVFSGFVNAKTLLTKYLLVVILLFWIFWGYGVIDGWKTSYTEGRGRMESILKTDFPKDKKIIIVGNPARVQQFFMYDNVMFPYNYFKYHNFVIKDSLSDLIRTIALDEESLNSELSVISNGQREYYLSCTGKTQFFNFDGDESQIKKDNGVKKDFLSAEILEYNSLGKPVRIKMNLLSENTECYIFKGRNLIKLN